MPAQPRNWLKYRCDVTCAEVALSSRTQHDVLVRAPLLIWECREDLFDSFQPTIRLSERPAFVPSAKTLIEKRRRIESRVAHSEWPEFGQDHRFEALDRGHHPGEHPRLVPLDVHLDEIHARQMIVGD